jgi:cobalt-zinc-cadmium efflux system membrane fusion protein
VKSIGQQRPNDLLPAVSAAFALGLFMGLLLRTRRLVPVAALTLLSVLALTSAAWPGGGDDHSHGPGGHGHGGGGQAPARLEDVPQRLPDGALFVPKPAQRLLEVRTTITKVETAQRGVALIGRVIADPNRSGLVQSINGGRVIAPEKGLPRIGQAVKRGEVLAQVEPALPQADRTTISERTGEIEQQIALAETKLNRIRPLAERGVVPQSQIIDIQTEIEGLKRRREIVGRTRVEPEVLRATIDGVIASAKVVAGQVVQGQDVLFQIVDPKGFWVEALVYGGINPAQITGASAAAADGTSLTLAPQGFSRALQEQASVVQFAVLNPASTLNVGQPVTVIAKSGAPVEGIILPREAVVRGTNGVPQVWHHTDPERFEARSVLTEPFDATRVVVRGGLSAGERIVVRGAELINQVR